MISTTFPRQISDIEYKTQLLKDKKGLSLAANGWNVFPLLQKCVVEKDDVLTQVISQRTLIHIRWIEAYTSACVFACTQKVEQIENAAEEFPQWESMLKTLKKLATVVTSLLSPLTQLGNLFVEAIEKKHALNTDIAAALWEKNQQCIQALSQKFKDKQTSFKVLLASALIDAENDAKIKEITPEFLEKNRLKKMAGYQLYGRYGAYQKIKILAAHLRNIQSSHQVLFENLYATK